MSTVERLPHLGPHTFHSSCYDEEYDVLYLSVGEPEEALTWESPEGHLVRVKPDTFELVALTILHYSRKSAKGISVTVPSPGELRLLAGQERVERLEMPEDFLTVCSLL